MTPFMEAVARTVHSFKAAGFEPPDVILLKDHKQGIRLVCELQQVATFAFEPGDKRMGKVIEHLDGSVWMEAEVLGVKIRWPAEKMALSKGGYVWT